MASAPPFSWPPASNAPTPAVSSTSAARNKRPPIKPSGLPSFRPLQTSLRKQSRPRRMKLRLPSFLTPPSPTKTHSRNSSLSTLYTPPVPHARDIPDPEIFVGLPPSSHPPSLASSSSTLGASTAPSLPQPSHPSDLIPSLAECTAHLELLGCFAELRRRVEDNRDEIDFGLGLSSVFLGSIEHTNEELRLERWKRFLVVASARFELWFRAWGRRIDGPCWRLSTLPPLEVLLVWHSFLLNPKSYRDYCNVVFGEELGEQVWATSGFRWKLLHDVISNYNFTYHLPHSAATAFTTITSHPADIFTQLSSATTDQTLAYTYSCHTSSRLDVSPHEKQLLQTTPYLFPTGPSNSFTTPLERATTESIVYLSLASTPYDTHLTAPPPLLQNAEKTFIDFPLAVLRQGVFIHSIHTHNLLIRSPSLTHTLSVARRQFARFFTLIAKFPGTVFVPTPVVDLVWHTLLLDPVRYENYCLISTAGHRVVTRTNLQSRMGRLKMFVGKKGSSGVGRFINHDDTIPEDNLHAGRDVTKVAYKRVWWKEWLKRKCGGEALKWGGCCCWGCEARAMGGEDTEGMVKSWKKVEYGRRKELGWV